MKKRIFLMLMVLLLAVNCLALPTCAAQEDASGADGLLLVFMPEESADAWNFLFVSTDPVNGKLMCTQIPADQPVSIRAYENHILSAGMTLGDVCALGYAWEEDAAQLEFPLLPFRRVSRYPLRIPFCCRRRMQTAFSGRR